MAAYISVPRDFSKVKSKVAFNLTARQLICFGAAAVVGVPLFFVLRDTAGNSGATLGMMAVMLPMFFLAMYQKNGQPAEKILRYYLQARFVRPKVRPYQTRNYYALLMKGDDTHDSVSEKIIRTAKSRPSPRCPARHRRASRFSGCLRTAPAVSVPATTPAPSSIRISTISWRSRRTRPPFLRNGARFLNFFDSSIHFELSFVNTATDSADFEKSIRIPYQQDGFDDVRAEYSQMLRQQLSKGNNGLTKTKFLTYGIEGDSMAQVKPRLEHIQRTT